MKNRNFLILMATLISVGIAVAVLLNKCQNPDVAIIPPQAQIDTVKVHERKLQPIIDSLNNINGELQSKDWLNKKSLAQLQAENKRLAKLSESHLDSMALYEPPDSIENEYAGNIKEIIANCAASDSVANVTIRNLDSTIVIAAKIINTKDSLYISLKRSFNTAIEQQIALQQVNSQLQRAVKKKTTLNKILGAIALVGAGFIINAAIK